MFEDNDEQLTHKGEVYLDQELTDIVYNIDGISIVDSNQNKKCSKDPVDEYYRHDDAFHLFISKLTRIEDALKEFCKENNLPFLDYSTPADLIPMICQENH
jgi:hypothetical protein